MSAFSWWRSWHGAPTDHKWAVIAARSGVKVGVVSAVAWALLDYASQQPERGTVAGFDTEEYSVYSGFPEDEVKAVIQAMTDKGIISNGRLTNWEKRQPKREDDSSERVRKHREMKRSVTHDNASETNTSLSLSLSDSVSDDKDIKDHPNIFTVYEREIGQLTPSVSDELLLAEREYPPGWIEEALREAAANNKRSWKYANGILRNWKENGRGGYRANGAAKKTRKYKGANGEIIEVEE